MKFQLNQTRRIFISFTSSFLYALLLVGLAPSAAEAGFADSGSIKGTVRAVAASSSSSAANAQSTVIAGAKLTLTNRATPDKPLETVSSAAGDFILDNLPSGDYTLL